MGGHAPGIASVTTPFKHGVAVRFLWKLYNGGVTAFKKLRAASYIRGQRYYGHCKHVGRPYIPAKQLLQKAGT
jgi:hypothetical protein